MLDTMFRLPALLLPVLLCAVEPVFWEQDGLVVFEVESVPATGSWSAERELTGFTGSGYYTWTGPDAMRSPGGGVLAYRIRITTPGTYQLRIRNRHDFHDSTEQNDCFTRMDGGEWVKTFSSQRGEWTWRSNHEFSHGDKPPAQYELSAGEHRFEISGRSHGFSIDRVHLFIEGAAGAEDPTTPESKAGPAMPALDALPKVARAWQLGALGKALDAAEDATSDDDPVVAAQASAAADALRSYAEDQRRRIAELKTAAPGAAVRALAELSAIYRGHDLGRALADEAKAWSREPAVRDALAAERVLAVISEAEAKLDRHGDASDPAWLKRNQRHLKTIVGGWQRLTAQHPEAPATAQAEALIDRLGLRALQ